MSLSGLLLNEFIFTCLYKTSILFGNYCNNVANNTSQVSITQFLAMDVIYLYLRQEHL